MLTVTALGCGILLGFAAAGLAAPLYWQLLAKCPLRSSRITRLFLRLQRRFLAHAGHHPYLVGCLEALEGAPDAAAAGAAQARLRWYCSVRLRNRL